MNRQEAIAQLRQQYDFCPNCDGFHVRDVADFRHDNEETLVHFVFLECEDCEWSSDEVTYAEDDTDEWLTELRRGATRRLEELWAEPTLTEADYHQSMITDD